ncbi:MAG: pyruvate synthase [Nitrospinae bacterium CG11_big_fil_rev_8_21_14_0_20_56_8]|nr:MAG: pyruvate synthase [Nitrospinae bacterium CG11_big_fil_rev_8_21_14_0_20_56_8]
MTTDTIPIKKIKEINRDELVAPGTPLCAGCGGLEALRLAQKELGENVLFTNAAGCFTLLSVYPFTPFRGSWLYTSMSSPAAAAQGIRDALDVRMDKRGLDRSEDMQVMVIAGDGSTYDMGLSPTSAAIHRGLDFIYFCYDNEGYGNTGFQLSAASPLGSATQTAPPTRLHPSGTEAGKKDLFSIWAAHHPPYIATVSPREPLDLINKVRKAQALKGPRLFISLAPCPTGWGFDPRQMHLIAKLAVDTGIFPLKEYEGGTVVHTRVPRKRQPVETYLELQKRFRHLFVPEKREDIIAAIQKSVDDYWGPYE